MTETQAFTGFPMEGLQFLRDLAQNNNKDWFDKHKPTYRATVQTPALDLVSALGERLQTEFPRICYDARTNGGSLMRIYRDTRFSANKAPYKTNVAMMFTPEGYKRMEAPGFGLQITPEQVELVVGMFAFSKAQLEIYREAILDNSKGKALIAAVAQVESAGDYILGDKELKRVPRGYDAKHPRAEWLKYKSLLVYAPPIPLNIVQTTNLLDVTMNHFKNMAPIYRWLISSGIG
ncbi:MAG: DUF2461 domain-containing protein [Anaerolineae bacterium]